MKTFLRRLEILNFLRGQHLSVSTEAIINHLEQSGHLDSHQVQSKSVSRLIQRDMNFLLGDKFEDTDITQFKDIEKEKEKEKSTIDSFDDFDNDFGLSVEKGQGKSLLWKLSPYQNLNYDFERMPAFMALALTLSEKHLKQILPADTRSELKKLFDNAQEKLIKSEQKLSTRHYQRLSQSVEFFQRGQRLQAASFDPLILDTIYRAILLGKRLNLSYQRGHGNRDYDLHPYGVVIMLPKLYLVAKKHNSTDDPESFRSFLVHKIKSLNISSYNNHVPDNFSLKNHLNEGHMDVFLRSGDQQDHTLVLHIKAKAESNLIEDLRENPISEGQQLNSIDDQTWQLTASVKRTIQLKNWLLALGSQAKIISPELLKQDLINTIDAIKAQY